ncbi:MAG: type II secretion system protein GspN [Deltaproteobacteria bacterium]|nr:type II secretion system protein GspN [Deltaproteobacteria bacterium]
MLKKFITFLLSTILLCLMLFMSFWLSISDEKLAGWLEYRLNQSLPQQVRAEISAVQTRYWGLEIEQIELKNAAGQLEWLKVKTFRIHFDLASIFFRQAFPYDFQLYGGQGSGSLSFSPDLRVNLKIVKLEPNWNPFIRSTRLVQSNPLLDLDGSFVLSTLAGVIQIKIKDINVTGKKMYTSLPLDLPDTRLTTIETKIALNNNQLDLAVVTAGDINTLLEGKVKINWKRIQRSRINLNLTADVTNLYQAKLGLINNIISSYRNKKGKISFRLAGNLKAPQIKKF